VLEYKYLCLEKTLKIEEEEPQSWQEKSEDGSKVIFNTYLDTSTKRAHLIIDREHPKPGTSRHIDVSHREYTPDELTEMVIRFGLMPEIFYLDYWKWVETPIDEDRTRRVVVVAEKPE